MNRLGQNKYKSRNKKHTIRKCKIQNTKKQNTPKHFTSYPSEATPKAEPVDRVTRSGIRTTKVKKKF